MTETFRTPDDRFANLPDWPCPPNYIEDLPGFDGLRMHYVDTGPGESGVTFLCIHGEPTWAYLFRKMIPVFTAAGHRVVAPDMFGFGRSDKPTDDARYTFHFHRDALLAFVERMDLTDICPVVQDWGGILGLTLPMEAPDRYTRLIVMNTALPAGEPANKGFADWRAYCAANPDLAVGKLMQRATPGMSDAEAAAYDAPFPDRASKAGVRRFPELVMVQADNGQMTEAASEGIETARRARAFWSEKWEGDSFMAVGMQDPVLGPGPMQSLRAMIRNCPEPMEVAEAGHFVQEWGAPIAEAALRRFGL